MTEASPLYGFFSQNLGHMPGYIRTATIFAEAFTALPGNLRLLYRHHPREAESNSPRAIDIFRKHGIDVFESENEAIHDDLRACDVVISLFSHCLYETILLNKEANRQVITPISLFFDPEIKTYYHGAVGQKETAYYRSGALLPIDDTNDLPEALSYALTDSCKKDLHTAALSFPADEMRNEG